MSEQKGTKRAETKETSAADKKGTRQGIPNAAPSPSQSNEPESTPKNQSAENQSSQELDVNRELATFTGRLVAVGLIQFLALVAQAVIFWCTLKENRRLIKSVGRLAVTASNATKMTRESFILTHRPKLIVRNVSVNNADEMFNPEAREPVNGSFFIANIGTGEGRIISVSCEVYRGDTLPMVPPFTSDAEKLDIALPSGKGTGWPFQTQLADVEMFEIGGILDQTANVYVIGRVGYIDDLENMRSTAFCRKWDNTRRRFFAVDDPDYEHAE